MKKSFKRYLSLVMVLMVAFVCLFSVSVSAADLTYSYTFTAKTYTANNQTKKLGDVSWTLAGTNGNY